MRVISQDGTIDVPYEYIFWWYQLEGAKMWNTFASIATTYPHHGTRLADYSSKAKAIKAIEMLREKYLSRMELDGGYDIVNKCYVQPNYWVLPKVFQFPQDDEIEV